MLLLLLSRFSRVQLCDEAGGAGPATAHPLETGEGGAARGWARWAPLTAVSRAGRGAPSPALPCQQLASSTAGVWWGLPGLLSPAWHLLPTATALVGRGPRLCHGWGPSPPTHQVPLLQQIAAGLGLQSQAAGWVCACLKRCLPGAGSRVMPAVRALRPAPIRDDGVALPLGRVPAW